MRLVLSETEQKGMAAAAQTLLSPFDAPVDQWRSDVLTHLTDLLGADAGGFMLPVGEGLPYTLRHLPDEFAREYIETYLAVDESMPMIRGIADGVWSTRMLAGLAGAPRLEDPRTSQVYHEFYGGYKLRDAIGFAVTSDAQPAPDGQRGAAGSAPSGALLTCFHKTFGSEAFGDRGLAMLRLLAPALEAGVAGRIRHHWMRGALEAGFDAARDGLLLCNSEGRRLYANAALIEILRNDPEAARIRAALEAVKSLRRMLLGTTNGGEALTRMQAASIGLRTARARYRIRGHLAGGEALEPGAALIVSVQQLTSELPSSDQLQEWWRLTGQEARVALLLARGMTNAKIAEALKLRSATVRHYTESVFSKLHVHSRGEAAYKILFH